jgi:hypothetical protein
LIDDILDLQHNLMVGVVLNTIQVSELLERKKNETFTKARVTLLIPLSGADSCWPVLD